MVDTVHDTKKKSMKCHLFYQATRLFYKPETKEMFIQNTLHIIETGLKTKRIFLFLTTFSRK